MCAEFFLNGYLVDILLLQQLKMHAVLLGFHVGVHIQITDINSCFLLNVAQSDGGPERVHSPGLSQKHIKQKDYKLFSPKTISEVNQ